ncbi:hypothetical protein PsorP6_008876 [Peronosclerospora sorghi]|uniref:Uncharacterized protein n=1 Tax=Peronosclerospora sorghi TaxID=230839 RepID=A0ACC0VZ66_9STRA|nr:hypothetical protein PsorP6_008876 [Peronosclerospora sorghi]
MQLENFKSYAGKVEIGPFHKYISAVVGPNGSGKSNVIDALLFVFGKRASNLHLNKVSELVHRSADFSDLDMATVSVFFHEIIDTEEGGAASEIIDNEANYVVVPNSEFRVTRTATKSKSLQDKGINLDNNRFLILQEKEQPRPQQKPDKMPDQVEADAGMKRISDKEYVMRTRTSVLNAHKIKFENVVKTLELVNAEAKKKLKRRRKRRLWSQPRRSRKNCCPCID